MSVWYLFSFYYDKNSTFLILIVNIIYLQERYSFSFVGSRFVSDIEIKISVFIKIDYRNLKY